MGDSNKNDQLRKKYKNVDSLYFFSKLEIKCDSIYRWKGKNATLRRNSEFYRPISNLSKPPNFTQKKKTQKTIQMFLKTTKTLTCT